MTTHDAPTRAGIPTDLLRNTEAELEPIHAVRTHPDNPRRGASKAITESIRANGFYGAIVAQRSTGYILAGNHRFLAAVAAGMTHVPVAWIDATDDEARRIMLADNRTSDLGAYDHDELARLLAIVAETTPDLTGTAYTPDDLASLVAAITANEYTPETPAPASTAEVTPDAIAAAETAEAARTAGTRDLHPAMCPNCGHEFYVD